MRPQARPPGTAAEAGSPAHAIPRAQRRELLAGRCFARLTALPTLLAVAWLVPGLGLLMAGRFLPLPMVLIAAPLAVILVIVALRDVPGRWPGPVGRVTQRREFAGWGVGLRVRKARHREEAAAAGAETQAVIAAPESLESGRESSASDAPEARSGGPEPESAPGAAATSGDPGADGPGAALEPGTPKLEAGQQPGAGNGVAGDHQPGAGNAGMADQQPGAGNGAAADGQPGARNDMAADQQPAADNVGAGQGSGAGGAGQQAVGDDAAVATELKPVRDPAVIPALETRLAPKPATASVVAAWWAVLGTAAVAAGFGVWQSVVNSPQLIVIRQPGALFQAGYWLATQGSLPIPTQLPAFGGAHPGLAFGSAGFTAQHAGLVPHFMPGLPIILAGGIWVHGIPAAALLSPVLGALAILTFGGLAGRLAGLAWAPPAALVLALALPELYTSRSAFGEPLLQVLLFGGLCLVIDSLTVYPGGRGFLASLARGRPPRMVRWPSWLSPATGAALLGGLALGLTPAVTVGSLWGLVAVIPFLGVLVAGRTPQALPLAVGLVAGSGYSLAAGYVLAPVNLPTPGNAMRVPVLIAACLALATIGAVVIARLSSARDLARSLLWLRPQRWVPELGAVVVAAVLIGFAIRPYVQTARWSPGPATMAYVAAVQRLLGLPVQPNRSYAEATLYWVIWYIGVPTLLLGGAGLALLTRRCLRALLTWRDEGGLARIWALPLAVIGWEIVSVLWEPRTLPDQPWASRQLVPVVLPGLILCAIWVAAWLDDRARERGASLVAVSAAAACFVVALTVPTAFTTFGVGLANTTAQQSALPAASGLAVKKTNAGEITAVRGLCATLGTGNSVVILDRVAADEFAQVIRGMCGQPVGVMDKASVSQVQAVLRGVTARGRRPVLLASRPAELTSYTPVPRKAFGLNTTQDAHLLTQPPTQTWQISYGLWISEPSGSTGA